MKLRFRYRLYPTDQQKWQLAKLFGCCRVVWNDALTFCYEQFKKGEKKPNYNQLSKRLTSLKQTEHKQWLTEVSSISLQQSLRDLEQAYSNFFKSCQGERKGKKVKPPKLKKRKFKQTARFTDNGFKVNQNSISLAKIGEIKIVWSRELPSSPSSVTIIKDRSDRYFASFVVDLTPQQLPPSDKEVGIDLGIIDFATLSNGEKIKAPKPLKKRLKRLKRLQRHLSRKQKGSKRREVARKRVAKLQAKVKDTREDFLHQLSTRLINENQVIALEDLNVSGMVKNRRLARTISDLGWYSFRTMLIAKGEMYGRDVRIINRWEATSQICSCCGFKGGKKELSVREWTCLNCGQIHDRDLNAATNILTVAGGQSDTQNGRGEKVRLSAKKAHLYEASTYFKAVQLTLF
jgi:putative transposase